MATPKQKAVWSATIAAATSALAWLANTPPEQQNALLGPLVDAMPVSWRPYIGSAMKLLSSIAIVYSTIQASHSGPATKPATDAQTGDAVVAKTAVIGSNYDPVAGNTTKTQRLTP